MGTDKHADHGANRLYLRGNLIPMYDMVIETPESSRRDIHTLICRLPPELLALIFILCARDHYSEPDSDILTREVPSWVNVSYVCRDWRSVALDCPAIWAYQFVVSLRWTEELLARSKEASLKIRLKLEGGGSDPWWRSPVEKLMNHAERIEMLTLNLMGPSTHRFLSLLASPAPRLQKLQISAPSLVPELSVVPFNGETPALCTLYLAGCPAPLNSFNLGSVTTLRLSRLPVAFQLNMTEFLSALRRMHGLMKLHLDGALASAAGFMSGPASHTLRKFSLPCLVHLSIIAPLSTVVTLLFCVAVPLNTVVRLHVSSEDSSTVSDYTSLNSVLAQRFSTCEDSPTIRSLTIDIKYPEAPVFLFSSVERDYSGYDSPEVGYWHRCIPLVATVHFSGATLAIRDGFIRNVCCSMPSAHLRTLYVTHPPFSPDFWRPTLGCLHNLRYIRFSNGNMPDIASVLAVSNTTHGNADQARDQVSIPDLEELELWWIKFSREGSSEPPEEAGISRRCLFDALSTRTAPDGRLTMSRCWLDGSGRFDMACSWGDGDVHAISSPMDDGK